MVSHLEHRGQNSGSGFSSNLSGRPEPRHRAVRPVERDESWISGAFRRATARGHSTTAAGGETAADPTLFAGITGELCLTGPPIDAGPGTGLCFGGPPTELCAEAVLRAAFPRKYIVTTRISGACFIAASYHETLKRRKVSPAYRQAPIMAPVAAGRLPARLATGPIARSDKGPAKRPPKNPGNPKPLFNGENGPGPQIGSEQPRHDCPSR